MKRMDYNLNDWEHLLKTREIVLYHPGLDELCIHDNATGMTWFSENERAYVPLDLLLWDGYVMIGEL